MKEIKSEKPHWYYAFYAKYYGDRIIKMCNKSIKNSKKDEFKR
jgi:hypothetical protein